MCFFSFVSHFCFTECVKQVEKTCESISQLSNQKKDLKTSIEKIKLEQKLVEKKTMNAIKDIEKTKADIENIKEKKEKLSIEMVDIEQGNCASNFIATFTLIFTIFNFGVLFTICIFNRITKI